MKLLSTFKLDQSLLKSKALREQLSLVEDEIEQNYLNALILNGLTPYTMNLWKIVVDEGTGRRTRLYDADSWKRVWSMVEQNEMTSDPLHPHMKQVKP